MKSGGPLDKNISCFLIRENGEQIAVPMKLAKSQRGSKPANISETNNMAGASLEILSSNFPLVSATETISAQETRDLLEKISKSPFAGLKASEPDQKVDNAKPPVLKARDDFGQIKNLTFKTLSKIDEDFIELERSVPVSGGFETVAEKYLYLSEETLNKRTALYSFDPDLFLIVDGKSFVKVKDINGASFVFPDFNQSYKIKNGACDLILRDRNSSCHSEYKSLAYKAVRDNDRDLRYIEIIADRSATKYIPASDLKDLDRLANLSEFLEAIDLRQEVFIDNGRTLNSFYAVKLRDSKVFKDLSETGSIFLQPLTVPPENRKARPSERMKRIEEFDAGDQTMIIHFEGPETLESN